MPFFGTVFVVLLFMTLAGLEAGLVFAEVVFGIFLSFWSSFSGIDTFFEDNFLISFFW